MRLLWVLGCEKPITRCVIIHGKPNICGLLSIQRRPYAGWEKKVGMTVVYSILLQDTLIILGEK